MAAVKTYEPGEYMNDLADYVADLFMKWLGISGAGEQETVSLLETIRNEREANHRVTYLKMLLPFVSEKHMLHYKTYEAETLEAVEKIIHSMWINDIRYNDYNVNRLVECMIASIEEGSPVNPQALSSQRLLAQPLHVDFMDIQKLLWTFIIGFKKKRNLPLVSDGRVEFY